MLKRLAVVLLCLILCAPTYTARAQQMMSRQTDDYFSTVSALFLYVDDSGKQAFEKTWAQVKETLGAIEAAVSVSSPDSDIARFNALPQGGECEISPLTAAMLSIAREVYDATGGLYDPTVYPLVDLWGFSPRFNANSYAPALPYDRPYENGRLPPPQERYIDALLPLVGFDGIALQQRDGAFFLRKNTPSVSVDGVVYHAQIDLGGIAKGYACDQVAALLRGQGYTMGHFVCGGSSMALLSRPTGDGTYALQLKKPRPGHGDETHYATVRAQNTTLSTSADSSHSFLREGVVYCHIIDPRTGWPVNTPVEEAGQSGLAAVTLLGESAAKNDAMTTALMLMGPERAAAYVRERLAGEQAVCAAFEAGSAVLKVWSNVDEAGLHIEDPAYIRVDGMPETNGG